MLYQGRGPPFVVELDPTLVPDLANLVQRRLEQVGEDRHPGSGPGQEPIAQVGCTIAVAGEQRLHEVSHRRAATPPGGRHGDRVAGEGELTRYLHLSLPGTPLQPPGSSLPGRSPRQPVTTTHRTIDILIVEITPCHGHVRAGPGGAGRCGHHEPGASG